VRDGESIFDTSYKLAPALDSCIRRNDADFSELEIDYPPGYLNLRKFPGLQL